MKNEDTSQLINGAPGTGPSTGGLGGQGKGKPGQNGQNSERTESGGGGWTIKTFNFSSNPETFFGKPGPDGNPPGPKGAQFQKSITVDKTKVPRGGKGGESGVKLLAGYGDGGNGGAGGYGAGVEVPRSSTVQRFTNKVAGPPLPGEDGQPGYLYIRYTT
jgi:hypothetical protein